jgi:ATP-dependent helicase/DNAse subunit B
MSLCEHSYFLNYTLGIPDSTGKSAVLGNMLHKAEEMLAKGKLLHQETGQKGGWDIGDEFVGEFIPEDIYDNKNIVKICKLAYNYYKTTCDLAFDDKDLIKIIGWANTVANYQNGSYDPRNHEIAHVEKFFDFEIKKDWAKYDYQIGDKKLEGYLGIKGTIDLIMALDNDTLEILDYKTGAAKDWATMKDKDLKSLQTDKQLLLYFYAARNTFPDIKHFVFTIYYLATAGPFTLAFGDKEYELAEKMIKNQFERIRSIQHPNLISPTRKDREKNFKCAKMCHYARNNQPGTDISICEFFQEEVKKNGADLVMLEHGDWTKISSYGSGGGRAADTKE